MIVDYERDDYAERCDSNNHAPSCLRTSFVRLSRTMPSKYISRSIPSPNSPLTDSSSESQKYPSSFSCPSTRPKNCQSFVSGSWLPSITYQVQFENGMKNFTMIGDTSCASVS